MTELVEVIIEEIVVKLKYALREEQQYQEDIGQQVGKEFNFFMVLKKRRKREGNGLYHYHRLLLDKEVVDGKVKQDFFTRVKELQGVILNKLFTLNEKKKEEEDEEHKKVVELLRKRQSETFAGSACWLDKLQEQSDKSETELSIS